MVSTYSVGWFSIYLIIHDQEWLRLGDHKSWESA